MKEKIKTYGEFKDYADNHGYEYVEVTTGTNGYPQGIHPAAIGFDNYEKAAVFAAETGGEVVSLRRRDGWTLYESRGTMYDEYDNTDVDDQHILYEKQDEDDFIAQECKDALACATSFDEMQSIIDNAKERFDTISDMEDDEVAILDCNGCMEVVKRHSMTYQEDVWHYVIGVEFEIVD